MVSNVSKRTIDYYTKMGLLECKRSDSNYRFYDRRAIEDLKVIEQCQRMHMTLAEIKQRLALIKVEKIDYNVFEKQVDHIKNEMEHLQGEISEILNIVNSLKEEERKQVLNRVSPQAIALLQSLAVFSV